jgi:hypothetical protein
VQCGQKGYALPPQGDSRACRLVSVLPSSERRKACQLAYCAIRSTVGSTSSDASAPRSVSCWHPTAIVTMHRDQYTSDTANMIMIILAQ